MERRRYPRIAVNLNVALLDEQAMPRGCRVRDVSQGGMLLQFEQQAIDISYTASQPVNVRASIKDGDQRRVLLLPATVSRVEEKGIGVEFVKPEAEMMQLLESYQLDRDTAVQAPVMVAERRQAGADGVHAFATARPRHRHALPNGGARLAERIAAAREAIASAGHLGGHSAATDSAEPAAGMDRRMLHVGLASLAVAVAIVIFDLAAGSSTRQRLAALENAAQQHAEALADVQIRLTADRDSEQLASLDNRVNQLAVSIAALETGKLIPAQETPAEPAPAAAAAAEDNQPQTPVASADAAPPADVRTAAALPALPSPAGVTGKGPWVINLASLYEQDAADRFIRRARDLGVAVEQQQAQVQGRPVWRLQIGGFATRDAALAYSDAHKEKLGIKKVWIFRR